MFTLRGPFTVVPAHFDISSPDGSLFCLLCPESYAFDFQMNNCEQLRLDIESAPCRDDSNSQCRPLTVAAVSNTYIETQKRIGKLNLRPILTQTPPPISKKMRPSLLLRKAKLSNAEALFAHRTRDVALKVVSSCGLYRICVVNTTALLQQTIDKHDLHAWETPALDLMGTTISFTNLLASLLQGEERVECKFHAAFGASMVCESLALGECRAFLGGAQQGAMANVLSVRRALYNNSDTVLSATVADFAEALPEERYAATFQFMGAAQERADRFIGSAARHAQQRFNLNLTPHAHHYFKQSEGIPTAVLLTTSVEDDYSHLQAAAASGSSSSSSGEVSEAPPRRKVVHSTGVLVQPLALDMKKENSTPLIIGGLQDLFNSIALCPAPPSVASVAHAALGVRAQEEGTLVQDILALVSGDYSGSYAVAKAARLMASDDVETVRLQYQPIRDRYNLKPLRSAASEAEAMAAAKSETAPASTTATDGTVENKPAVASEEVLGLTALELDPTTVTRTALDFFCRCSAESITQSFTAMPVADRQDLVGKTAGCVYCGKEYVLKEKHLGLSAAEGEVAAGDEPSSS